MRLKHWQGYGTINATVSGRELNTASNTEIIKIKVWGNHEYGLDRSEDKYDIFRWLLKRLVKAYKNIDCNKAYKIIKSVSFSYIGDIDGQEAGLYTITTNYYWD